MKIKSFIIAVCIFPAMLFYKTASAEELKQVKVMYFYVPPFVIVDEEKGTVSGAVYDLLENYIAAEIGVKFEWDKIATAIPRQLTILSSKKDCMSALMVYSPEREKSVTFTAKSYFDSVPAIAVLNNRRLDKITSINDILDLKIGYGKGVFLSPFMRDSRLKMDFVSGADFAKINLKKMLKNRLDAVYVPNKIHILYEMRLLNLEDRVKVIDLPEKRSPHYVAFSKDAGHIAAKYNKAFDKLDVKNLYIRLLNKYINTSKL